MMLSNSIRGWRGWGFANMMTTPETQAEHPNQRKLYVLQNHTSTVLRE